jgi:hypothetical protein
MLFPQEFHIFDIIVYFIHTIKIIHQMLMANILVMSFRLPILLYPIIKVLKTRYTDHSTEHYLSLLLSDCFLLQNRQNVLVHSFKTASQKSNIYEQNKGFISLQHQMQVSCIFNNMRFAR